MKQYTIILLCLLASLGVRAQEQPKFSPEKFEADLEAFITREAGLDQQEAAKFFPLLKEMHQKQRVLYARMRKTSKEKPAVEETAAESIRLCDKLNIEVRQIEQQYHNKMLKALPAQKVYNAISAENRFHRKMMRGWQKPPAGKPKDRRH